ncbi:MAG: hypothetical protein ABIB71_02005 [Candidatus Woesearchaeota archaeon]
MKAAKLFWIIAAISIIATLAYAIDSTTIGTAPLKIGIAYEDSLDLSTVFDLPASSVDGFTLVPQEGRKISMTMPRTTADTLYLIPGGDYYGIYRISVQEDSSEVLLPVSESSVELVLNGIAYTLQFDPSPDEIQGSAIILETELDDSGNPLKDDAIKHADLLGYKLYFTSEGKLFIEGTDAALTEIDLPLGPEEYLKFRTMAGSEEALEAQGTAAAESASEEGELADELILEQGCHDKDAGENAYYIRSYAYNAVRGSARILDDICAYSILQEAYCNEEGKLAIKEVDCGSPGCTAGACNQEMEAMSEPEAFCFETDLTLGKTIKSASDAELKHMFGSPGLTVGFYSTDSGKEFGIWKDTCSNSNTLVEYHCGSDGKARFLTASCKCSEGSCRFPVCWDTDGGDNPSAKGTVSIIRVMEDSSMLRLSAEELRKMQEESKEIHEDICSGNSIKEYFCDSSNKDQYASKLSECAGDEICSGGICVPEEEIAECTSDLNCNIGEVCTGGMCVAESIIYSDSESVADALRRRIARADALAGIINQLEESGELIAPMPADDIGDIDDVEGIELPDDTLDPDTVSEERLIEPLPEAGLGITDPRKTVEPTFMQKIRMSFRR